MKQLPSLQRDATLSTIGSLKAAKPENLPIHPYKFSLFMKLKQLAGLILLAIPIILPPYLQYREILSAPATLGLIIAAYIPIWIYFKYSDQINEILEKIS